MPETQYAPANGLTIAYERAGTGPPVALAHGFVGDARSTWDGARLSPR